MTPTALIWLRRDLRLADNPALHLALERGERPVPLYILAPEEEAPWAPGGASRWWLHHSLAALGLRLAALGSGLVLARGDSLTALRDLARAAGGNAVYWSRLYDPATVARDSRIKQALLAPDALPPLPQWSGAPAHLPLEALGLLPHIPWDTGLAAAWAPGEAGAQARLSSNSEFETNTWRSGRKHRGSAASARPGEAQRARWPPRESVAARRRSHGRRSGPEIWNCCRLRDFLPRADAYAERRDLPGQSGASRLSPHLHFGEVSPRQVLVALAGAVPGGPAGTGEPFVRELGWREFAHQLLYHYPHTTQEPLTRASPPSPGAARGPRNCSRPGRPGARASPWWTPACANCGRRVSCTTG